MDNDCFFICRRKSPFSVCCLLCYSANWLHFTLIACEFQALQYYTYQHVIVTLDVAKWTKAAATELKRAESMSKCIPNIIQSEKVDKVAVFLKAHKALKTKEMTLRK